MVCSHSKIGSSNSQPSAPAIQRCKSPLISVLFMGTGHLNQDREDQLATDPGPA